MRLVGHPNRRIARPRILAIDQHWGEHFAAGSRQLLADVEFFGQLIGVRNRHNHAAFGSPEGANSKPSAVIPAVTGQRTAYTLIRAGIGEQRRSPAACRTVPAHRKTCAYQLHPRI